MSTIHKVNEICDYEGSTWRSAFWRGRDYEDQAERIALNHVLPPTGKHLCEVGAGFGRLAEYYRGYERVILIDYAHSMLKDAVDRLGGDPRFIFVAADLYNLPLADSALDTAVTVRVLHHVTDIPCAFSEISRVLRPCGTYVTEFANKRHLKARLKYALAKRGANPDSLEPYEFVKLNFDFHPRYIRQELDSVHLTIQDTRAVSTFRLSALKRLVPARLLAAIDATLQHPTRSWEISPSLFLRASSNKPGAPVLNSALWRCPTCHSIKVAEKDSAWVCASCARVYPIIDHIIHFKIAESQTAAG